MNKEFIVLKNKPFVDIELTRDSVCAGDDIDAPHKRTIKSRSFIDPIVLVSDIYSEYLPNVDGHGHTWDCIFNNQLIAVIAKDKIIPKTSEVIYNENNKIFFKYHSSIQLR
jgi:hypothetical protein